MGDVNFDYNNRNFSCQKWKHIIELNNLHQVTNKPTRITAHSETVIDHVYVTTPENVADIFVPSIAVSYHYPACFTRTTAKIPSKDMIINVYNIVPILILMKIHFMMNFLKSCHQFRSRKRILIFILKHGQVYF